MAKNLVIVESPAKAKTIGKFLGKNYKIKSSVGHIRDLPKSKLGIDIENNFEPRYITIRGKGPVLAELKKEAKKADKVYLATDPDREGEAISWHLAIALGLSLDDYNRIEFNEITKNAVKNAVRNPRQINQGLVDAQQARRILDRLVGYSISPLLWKKVSKGLSAGRVQSVTTKLICDREREIEDFIPEEYWSILGFFNKGKVKLEAKYNGVKNGDKVKKVELNTKEDVEKVIAKIDLKQFSIDKIKTAEKKKNPSAPYTTSSLQQDAAKKLGYSTKKTMRIAQQLYEGIDIKKQGTVGLITYIRTDSVRISDEALESTKNYILENFKADYYDGYKKYSKKKKAIQDAHEAIRPSDVERSPALVKESLSRDQYRLYNLIWQRFVGSQMTPAIVETITISINSNDQIFKTSGSRLSFNGFMEVYDKKNSAYNFKMPKVSENDKIECEKLEEKQHFTKPPARYTEASLVKTMEELGIGRPSTYAPTVGTILARRYVYLETKQFYPTDLGLIVTEILEQYFKKIMDKDFTAQMEADLDNVEDGTNEWKSIIANFYKDFEKDLQVAEEEISKIEIEDEVTDVICELCGKNMVKKRGRFGEFLACPGYPECRNTKPIIIKVGVTCPKCNEGEIIEKRSKKGRTFYGCDRYPECDFVSWDKPHAKKCDVCGELTVVKRRRGKEYIRCTVCGHQEEIVENKEIVSEDQ